MATYLSPHFTLEELTASGTARAQNLNNTPGAPQRAALQRLAGQVLEPFRDRLGGKPIKINSGYRSPAVNAAVGGASSSQHMKGEASDIMVSGFTGEQLAKIAYQSGDIPFDQVIWYASKPHLHVSHKTSGNRRQFLYKNAAGKYVSWAPPGGNAAGTVAQTFQTIIPMATLPLSLPSPGGATLTDALASVPWWMWLIGVGGTIGLGAILVRSSQ